VTIVPRSPYDSDQTFITAFAVRVEDAVDPEQFVISDIVIVEGGYFSISSRLSNFRRTLYAPGQVMFSIV